MENISQILRAERDRLICWLPVLFGLGIGIYFALPTEPSYWLTLVVIELVLLLAYICRFYPAFLKMIAVLAIILAGFTNIQLKTLYLSKNLPRPTEAEIYIRGQVIEQDTNYNGRPRIVLGNMKNFDDENIKGHYRLTLMHKENIPPVGQCVELVASVGPTMTADMVGGYQPDRRLFFDGINGSGYVISGIYKIDCDKKLGFWTRQIDKLRQNINSEIARILPTEQAAVAMAIITGNRDLMTNEQIENYRASGLAHFLSISGLHMSMIAGLMFFAVRLFMALIPALGLRYNSKRIAAVLSLIVSSAYLIISGSSVPTWRAYIMISLVLIAICFERRAITMRVLAIAAMIILVLSPQMLVNISFQLSFAAVVALVAFYEKFSLIIERVFSSENRSLITKALFTVGGYLTGIAIASLVAGLATLPFAIYHFNNITIYTLLANLSAGPIIGIIIMPAVLLSLLLFPFGLEKLTLQFAGWGIETVNNITSYVSSLPDAKLEVYSFPLWGLLLIIFGGLWLCLWQKSWRHLGWILIVAGSLSLLTVKTPDVIAGDEGKAIAVRNSQGKLQLLPGGNKWMKQNWQKKFKSSGDFAQENITVPDLSKIDFNQDIGISIYGNKILTVRDYIGHRPWN